MAIVLGLLASITYGAADFLGGILTRRAGVITVVFLSQVLGTFLLVAAFPLLSDAPYDGSAVAWGAAAGVAGATGVSLLFRGLAAGRMTVVAPITGTVAATLPVVFGFLLGERPSLLAIAGIVVALVAVVLVSSGGHGEVQTGHGETGPARTGVAEALGAGTAFGLFFILLDRAGDASGLWPLAGARASSVALLGLAALVTRTRLSPNGTLGGIAVAGALDVAANLFYLLATRRGLLALVAVLTSMYPATTVLLARTFLKERMSGPQLLGLACAAGGIALITIG